MEAEQGIRKTIARSNQGPDLSTPNFQLPSVYAGEAIGKAEPE